MGGFMRYSRVAVLVVGMASILALEVGWRVMSMLSHIDKSKVEMLSEASIDDRVDGEEDEETAFC